MTADDEREPPALPEEERLRAQVYALLGRLLARPPDAGTLAALGVILGDGTPLGGALDALSAAARATTPAAVAAEHAILFIGVSGGELNPYASFYRTGFLNEKPLADLRADMARLGIERADTVREPEDHAAALCEMMAGLITGAFGEPLDVAGQRRFYDRHVGSWMPRFLAELETAPSASFYRAVAAVGLRFLEVEGYAFELAA